jgi:TusA-related sulfurtransferase
VPDRAALDLRGLGCGSVLIELAKLARSAAGEHLVDVPIDVLIDDRGADSEIPAWCRMTGHHLDGIIPTARGSVYRIVLHPHSTAE